MSLTFEQLPDAIEQVNLRLERIEAMLSGGINQPKKESKILTLPEAAGYCRIAVPTFRAHLGKGKVVGSKPGRSWVFREVDLDCFLAKYRSKSKEEIQSGAEEILV